MRLNTFATSLWTTAGLVMAGSSAFAQEVNQELEIVGKPVNGAMGFQPAATELARDVHWLDNMLLVICVLLEPNDDAPRRSPRPVEYWAHTVQP